MSNEKNCQNCGAKNQPYAAFCANCGNSFIPAPASPPPTPPPPPPPAEPLGDEPLYAAPPEPPRRFKKRYVLYGVLVLLSLLIVAGAISASQQAANRSIATSTPEVAAIAAITPTPEVSASVSTTATPSASASATPSTTPSPPPDYASRLNTVGLGAGLVSASPFEKVTLNGKQAYAGTLIKGGQTYNAQVYPINSYSEALAFKDQLISAYKSQGYATYTPGSVADTSVNIWYGLSGNTLVSISAMPTSQIDAPVILVMTATIQR
ncbi:MAG: zinc ribbon domain-containing protein [Halobacteriota archaeon]